MPSRPFVQHEVEREGERREARRVTEQHHLAARIVNWDPLNQPSLHTATPLTLKLVNKYLSFFSVIIVQNTGVGEAVAFKSENLAV